MLVSTKIRQSYPSWATQDLLERRNRHQFQKALEEIDWMIQCLYTRFSVEKNENLLLRQLQIYYDARQKIHSLKTRCRAARNLYPNRTDILHFQGEVSAYERRLRDQATPLLQALLHYPSTNPTIHWWKEQLAHDPQNLFLCADAHVDSFAHQIDERLLLPLESMHAQIMSMMRVATHSRDGVDSQFSFARCINVLKSSEDLVLRQSTFENFFAWLATNAAPLCSLLNAITGYRQTVLDTLGMPLLDYIARTENIEKRTLLCLRDSLLRYAQQTQRLVCNHAKAFGCTQLPLAYLNAPALHSKHRFSFNVQDCLYYMRTSTALLDPHFSVMLDKALAHHWIDMRPSSGKAGTAWCDWLPSEKEFRIFSSFHPSLPFLWQFMHLLGVARLFAQTSEKSEPILNLSLARIEIIGQLYTTMLEQHMITNASKDPRIQKIVRWQKENRQINMLLNLPVRHFFTERIMRKRSHLALSISDMNHIARQTWDDFFGTSTQTCDTYFWAYKTHFYKSQTICYDWQYSLGYILSFPLYQAIQNHRFTNWNQALMDFSSYSIEEWFERYLHLDLQNEKTWDQIFTLIDASHQ